MKSNRFRVHPPPQSGNRWDEDLAALNPSGASGKIDLSRMPAPVLPPPTEPDQIIEDILVATLLRVQRNSSKEIVAAAQKYLQKIKNPGPTYGTNPEEA